MAGAAEIDVGARREARAAGGTHIRRQLRKITEQLLAERTLILASNRGPIEYRRVGGALRAKRGAGGVVTAVSAISGLANPIWIAAALGPGDRERAAEAGGRPIEES